MVMYNWINPPVNFNAPHIVVRPWKPPWFTDSSPKTNWQDLEEGARLAAAEERESALGARARAGGAVGMADGDGGSSLEGALIEFWQRVLTETDAGQEWLEGVRHKVHAALNIPWQHSLSTREGGSPFRPKPAVQRVGERVGERGARADDAPGDDDEELEGMDVFHRVPSDPFQRLPSVFERVPSFVRRSSSSGFQVRAGGGGPGMGFGGWG
jgi:hypothetical protein